VKGLMDAIDKLRSRGLKKDQLEEYELCQRLLTCLEVSREHSKRRYCIWDVDYSVIFRCCARGFAHVPGAG
jgi:hypothetical protein